MIGTNRKGDVAEAKVIAFLVQNGYKVSIPFGNYRYDIIIDDNTNIYRVQIKTARLEKNNEVLVIPLCSSCDRFRKRIPYEKEIDFIIAYSNDLDKFYQVNHNDFENIQSIYLRFKKCKNNMTKRINWADDFEIKNSIRLSKDEKIGLFFKRE